MRDPLRELDLERALGATAGDVEVHDAGGGRVRILVDRDAFDRLLVGNPGHWGCRTASEVEAAYKRGRAEAIAGAA